jgi:DNA-binding MarR family transcriptional regulator
MHHVLFLSKRAYHRSLAKAAPLIRGFGLTPARYDLMFLLFERNVPAQMTFGRLPLTQSDLWHSLGVCRETVRRMLLALEERGYVRRAKIERGLGDRRTRFVLLTDLGRHLVRRATKLLFPDGLLAEPGPRRREPLHLRYEAAMTGTDLLDKLRSLLGLLARSFGDRALHAYPTFDPDD